MCEDRIDQLVQHFADHLTYFAEHNPYNGPSLYFHEKVMAMRRGNCLETLLESDLFIEYLYALLPAWGMHRMTQSPRLKDFTCFSSVVRDIGRHTLDLQFVRLGAQEQRHIDLLCDTLREHTIMASAPRLVGNSKLLHHLFPDLVPPIDRKYTLWFFRKAQGARPEVPSAVDAFRFIMDKYSDIHNRVNWEALQYHGTMSDSHPKLIDNAIISYRLSNGANAV